MSNEKLTKEVPRIGDLGANQDQLPRIGDLGANQDQLPRIGDLGAIKIKSPDFRPPYPQVWGRY
ncbi:MAG: hypothetical protein GW795_11555 [Cyanobacteria bacterium]|nr:hypothetical protein [Cyanobacteria bacterium CG_2015-16_32_12]NCO78517.1 hypothetical protein [Cyanobacteria bacterium CG_2015-22_32_23]NCQ42488.1 hypothetical protein [Cyanobacteria bacterium CG_2015-04_32_10]NCS85634.1 hypothetical protein [Cyanobacteria bacterium CG_2015-02_32_10]